MDHPVLFTHYPENYPENYQPDLKKKKKRRIVEETAWRYSPTWIYAVLKDIVQTLILIIIMHIGSGSKGIEIGKVLLTITLSDSLWEIMLSVLAPLVPRVGNFSLRAYSKNAVKFHV